MKSLLTKFSMICLMACACLAVSAKDIHVATTGSDDNAGTEAAPLLTIHKAMEIVQPGDRILVHEGTYMISKRIKIPALNTNPDLRCELRAWPEDAVGKVIIDGTNMNPSSGPIDFLSPFTVITLEALRRFVSIVPAVMPVHLRST